MRKTEPTEKLSSLFGITTPEDFFAKLEADYADFNRQPDSARLALNCIITAYHLHDWVWARWLKRDAETEQKIGWNDKNGFAKWPDEQWPGFVLIQELTNGTKHLKPMEKTKDTKRIAGYSQGPYGVGPSGRPYLLIDYGDDAGSGRWRTVDDFLDEALMFWSEFLKSTDSKRWCRSCTGLK